MWKHKNSGRLYAIINFDALVKVDGVWLPAVVYKNMSESEPMVFVRPKENFLEKFQEVESIGGV